MNQFIDDLKYGIRLLRRTPGFSLAAILALALGIGANTAIFSVVDAVLLARLPYADPDRLVMVWEENAAQGFPRNTPAPANWVDWRKQNTVFTDIAATRGGVFTITGDGAPEQVFRRRVTANMWTILGAEPVVGRVFTEEEDKANAPVVVISYGLWQRRYGGDTAIAGRKILLNDQPYVVTGVMPRDFTFPLRGIDTWTPSGLVPQDLARRGSHFLNCVARLKRGVTLGQAQSEMNVIMARLATEYPDTNRHLGATVVPLREQIVGDTRTTLIALLCAAGCVLLIACANIANLLLARGSDRRREMAVRAALGAGRKRLAAQLLTESVVLALLGASAGLGLARLGMSTLGKLVPSGLPAAALHLDLRLLAFTLGVAVLTGLLFGAAPALAGARSDLQDALKQGGRGSAGQRRHLLRDGLVVAQVSLALALLTSAGLMIRTLYFLQQVNVGIRTDHVLTMQTYLPGSRYPDHPKRHAFYDAVLHKVRALPGVVNAGYTSDLPFTTTGNTNGYIIQGETPQESLRNDALFRVATTDFFATMGAQLREGRFFTDMDRANTQPVIMVNETFANRHWPGQSALGKGIQINNRGPQAPWLIVIGVVKEIRERGIDVELKPVMYRVDAQSANEWPTPADLAIRTSVDPMSLAPAVRQAIWSVDKDQPVRRVRTMEEVAEVNLANRRQSMTLLGLFAGLALVLAFIGIYGVLSYTVSQRSREIAVRMAMGARPGQVLRMVAARGLGLVGCGLAIGAVASMGASRLISTMLFGVKGTDLWTLASVSLLLALVALAGCLMPARRAAGVDPASALRDD